MFNLIYDSDVPWFL